MPSATIKLFLVHGDARSLRTAEISNWTGKAVAAPRSEAEALLGREESQKPGVYFLAGIDSASGQTKVYIGEAESIRDRLRQHLGTKDFWNHVYFFISKDDNLTKAHIRYLEGRLITQAQEAKRATIENRQESGARLPESDREDMEIFLSKIHQLLPVLGGDFLNKPALPGPGEHQNLLYCEIKGLVAKGKLSSSGLTVLKGSQAAKEEWPSTVKSPWIQHLRQKLLDSGCLQDEGNFLRFTQDEEFPSPSAAAAVIHGGSANGLTAWKNKSGKTLKQLESTPDSSTGQTTH